MARRWLARGWRNRAAFLATAVGWGSLGAACTDAGQQSPSPGGSSSLSGGSSLGGSSSLGGNSNLGGGSSSLGGGSAAGSVGTVGGASTSGGVAGARTTGGSSASGGVNAAAGTGGGAQGGDNPAGGADGSGGSACGTDSGSYDQVVLCDEPVGYWAMTVSSGSQEADLTGNGSTGTYKGPTPTLVALPNGDQAASFNGSSNYLTIASKAAFSITATKSLTWEAWIQPAVLQFPNDSGGYVDWLGKCASYSPTCEWEARMYNTDNSQNRCNRLSAYVFNSSAGLGSGADWQPTCGLFQAKNWLHVVGEYTTLTQPSDCSDAATYPGAIDIWVNGVKWNHSRHGQTGCLSQYQVIPKANDSPVNVGTMATDAWFQGAIGKVAIYDSLLSQTQITNHYRVMTGKSPTGSCQDTCTF